MSDAPQIPVKSLLPLVAFLVGGLAGTAISALLSVPLGLAVCRGVVIGGFAHSAGRLASGYRPDRFTTSIAAATALIGGAIGSQSHNPLIGFAIGTLVGVSAVMVMMGVSAGADDTAEFVENNITWNPVAAIMDGPVAAFARLVSKIPVPNTGPHNIKSSGPRPTGPSQSA